MLGYDAPDGEESKLVAVETHKGSVVGNESEVAPLLEEIIMDGDEGSRLDSDVLRDVDGVTGGPITCQCRYTLMLSQNVD